jgi:hypothetical protein
MHFRLSQSTSGDHYCNTRLWEKLSKIVHTYKYVSTCTFTSTRHRCSLTGAHSPNTISIAPSAVLGPSQEGSLLSSDTNLNFDSPMHQHPLRPALSCDPLPSFLHPTASDSPVLHHRFFIMEEPDSFSGCYKCGATDHFATNRNCPRPRKKQEHDPSSLSFAPLPSKQQNRHTEMKFIKEARQGDSTKFWYYPSGSGTHGIRKRSVDDAAVPGRTISSDGTSGLSPTNSNRTDSGDMLLTHPYQRRNDSPEQGIHVLQNARNSDRMAKNDRAPEQQSLENPVGLGINLSGESTPFKQPAGLPGQSEIAATSRNHRKITAKAGNPVKTTTSGRPKRTSPQPIAPDVSRSASGPKAPSKVTKKPAAKKSIEPPQQVAKPPAARMPVITREYLEWCDLPEIDPYSSVNLQNREWNYLGVRNSRVSVIRPNAILYGDRDLQGWRECRSTGCGLGNSSYN